MGGKARRLKKGNLETKEDMGKKSKRGYPPSGKKKWALTYKKLGDSEIQFELHQGGKGEGKQGERRHESISLRSDANNNL